MAMTCANLLDNSWENDVMLVNIHELVLKACGGANIHE